jgi:hypothetical protein
MVAFETRPNSPGSKSSLSNFPSFVNNSVKNELVMDWTESQTALNDIISKLIQHQWRHKRLDVLADKLHLLIR